MDPTAPSTLELDAEYRAMREEAGLLDRSQRGKLLLTGADAAEFLQGQLTNDVEALPPGGGCYAALLDRKGRMQADMRVLRLGTERIWIDTEAEPLTTVTRHLNMYRIGRQVDVEDLTSLRAILSLIGPRSAELLGEPLGAEHSHHQRAVAGIDCIAVATDGGADLICGSDDRQQLADALVDAGAERVGEPAAEIVRVESGRPRFGAEITSTTIPQEAGINERAVSFEKGCYIGQETVARLHYKGKPNRHLRRLRPAAAVSAGEAVFAGGREVGRIGSAVLSPAEGHLALAILRREAEPGATVRIGDQGEGGIEATVEELSG